MIPWLLLGRHVSHIHAREKARADAPNSLSRAVWWGLPRSVHAKMRKGLLPIGSLRRVHKQLRHVHLHNGASLR